MENYTPVQIPEKKEKKVNKFLIFGNLFLVILVALIGYFYYNKTLLTTQQKAGFECSDRADAKKCKAEKREYEDSGKKAEDREKQRKEEQEEKRAREKGETKADGSCPSGFDRCSINGHAFCADNSGEDAQTCNSRSVELGYSTYIGGGGSGTGGWRCVVGQGKDYPYVAGKQCVEGNSVQNLGNVKVPNCFCGVIQIDNDSGGGSYQSTCGCNKTEKSAIEENPPGGTIVPTPTGENSPTPTRTPTPSPTRTPTPTVTPLISNTPTVTPLISNTPTVTPLISNTPGPSATPTEIIIASGTVTPTTVSNLLQTGTLRSFIYLIPAAILMIGLIL